MGNLYHGTVANAMSIEAIRCPGCKKLVNVAELEAHYREGAHSVGVVQGATTITTANPGSTPSGPEAQAKAHLFDSPIWGPLLRRYFPHILFAIFALGLIMGIVVW